MRFPQLAALQRHGLVALETDWATDIPPIERRGIKCTYFRALLASGLFGTVTTRDFIAGVVVPVTFAARVPWWAIVPPAYRGTSNAFVSHAWYDWFVSDSPRGITATLALELAREPDLCVWMDAFCLNQHTETTGLSPTLHATLRFAKTVYVTVSDYAMFDRSWCMYELASALMLKLTFRARVGLPGRSLEGYYSGNPEKAAAFDPVDKKAIDEAILAHFGDWDAIDRLLEHFTTRCSANFVLTDEQP